jgi:hypothetical protein
MTAASTHAAPPPKTTAPASWRLTHIALRKRKTWGGLVGGRGHRKGQLRVLGTPPPPRARVPHTKNSRAGGYVR